jgi:hypothetical protein
MSFIQRLFAKMLPKRSMEAMKAESEDWILQCPSCSHEISIWEIGGIRYGAKSRGKRTLLRCQGCGKRTWHRNYRKSAGQQQQQEEATTKGSG